MLCHVGPWYTKRFSNTQATEYNITQWWLCWWLCMTEWPRLVNKSIRSRVISFTRNDTFTSFQNKRSTTTPKTAMVFGTSAASPRSDLCPLHHFEAETKWTSFRRRHFQTHFLWIKMLELLLKFHWSLFLGVKLTIFQHWFRKWLGAVAYMRHSATVS